MHSMELVVVRASLVSKRRRPRSVRLLQQIIAGSLKSGRRIALSGGTRVLLVAVNDSRTLTRVSKMDSDREKAQR